ncbi:LysM peptidoglycan-binding domain-containing protein [Pontibacillus marinus]|uniref:LysM peptidoglycan-binding domain-containing protein n=1 Tax=Pontibacillus marinus TaxID=273164 RepID=UPI0003FB784F|nr:LysM peptidoglycan-binding domain-containing protein [Pontibacillus marinus]
MIHVVKSGDALWKISQKYGVSIQAIREVNGLASVDQLVPGLALYIPTESLNDRVYVIQAGDTYWKLAQRFQTSIQLILDANPGVDPNLLSIGQQIQIPSPQPLSIETLGFLVPYNIEPFLPRLQEISQHLTYLAVVAYTFTEEGYAYKQGEDEQVVKASKQFGIQPLLCIRNFTGGDFSAELVGSVFTNSVYRTNLVQSIVRFVNEQGYAGVSIDFEFVPPAQRKDFELFLAALKIELGDRILHVNVHAKTADVPTNPIIGAYDYEIIGEIADIVAVMTIDYGYPTGPPKAVAPIWWMEEVIRFALSKIPARKMQVSFPMYGYDKVIPGFETSALSALDAQNMAIRRWLPIQFEERSQSPHYGYVLNNRQHEVWFEDIRSYQAKYRLLDVYNLLGTTFWQVRFRFPQNWAFMDQHINVMKNLDKV